jgi:4'-phosphopantetheinyl transferase
LAHIPQATQKRRKKEVQRMKLYGTHTLSPLALLAQGAAETWGLAPLPEISRTAEGKPYFPSHPHLQFSLSHSGDLVLCALSGLPVGVDIELVVPRQPRLPQYALTGAEYARYEALGGSWPAFYALWTRREAWCKYTGLGLAKTRDQDIPDRGLFFGTYQGQGWQAAVCGREAPPETIQWREVPCDRTG